MTDACAGDAGPRAVEVDDVEPRAPAVANADRDATGSSPYAVSWSKSPWRSRTTRPPRRSIAGRMSNGLAFAMAAWYRSSTLIRYYDATIGSDERG